MPDSTFISKIILLIPILAGFSLTPAGARVAWGLDPVDTPKSQTDTPEAEDFSETPYTSYGSFDEDEEESANAEFFQHSRFFGVSLGAGLHGITGNRGAVYRGGFPLVSVRLQAWVTSELAVQLGFTTVSHTFDTPTGGGAVTNVTLFTLGADAKYYFDTRNLSAAITFANPYVLAGVAAWTKSEYDQSSGGTPDVDNTFGFAAGGGVEFAIVPKKSYFFLEGRFLMARFLDTYSSDFQPTVSDLTGYFWSATGGVFFTW